MKLIKSPILEMELHKIFESYPDILADVFVEAGILATVKAKHLEVFYSAYRNRLKLTSGVPDLVVGIRGEREHYLVEIKTLAKVAIEQMLRYHREITRLLDQEKYPHAVRSIIPLFIRPHISVKNKKLLNQKLIRFIELDNLSHNNTENIICERDRRIYQSRRVRREIPTLGVHRATYVLPLLDYLFENYQAGSLIADREGLLKVRSKILVSKPKTEPLVRPPFARISEIARVAESLGLIEVHKKGNQIVGMALTRIGRDVAESGMERVQRIVFTEGQLRHLIPALVDHPFKNFLVYGIFAMLETIIELGLDTDYDHVTDVFKHKVGLCQKAQATINSTAKFYLNYCEDLGLIIRPGRTISPTELGRIAYRVMRTNEVEAVAKREIVSYLRK